MKPLFSRVSGELIRGIDTFTDWTGKLVAWAALAMVLGMSAVVILRYVFAESSIALQELATYFHALLFLAGAAFTLKANEHVRVDILHQRFSAKTRASIEAFGFLFFLLPVCVFLIVVAWDYVAMSWKVREASREAGGLPGVYLLKSLLLVMPVLLIVQGLSEALKATRKILGIDASEASHA
ncbi:TRAP transporter small permease subunit [Permianibacter aggregans]|uniref:TRAP transporter small permease protein n=1 Tax=Permianibacter aggregans TaxID=1510150 RepID=A0A4R6UL59_9GAMM|nr:TRAP transporter small permease subunit [Permianibacter aggregans]QGX39954.1 TRAP transporter small permease subunit [Permianibacter aggregans]TDQ46239.1 TRAP-type mannitol/chloroaromatic compound transport system permease small subunit [Permianibacter aggregans]